MVNKVLVIPDIHGETFWKEPVLKYINQVDRVIFLGDYLDPYSDEEREYTPQGILDNLMDIIELKREHMDKVVLLKGNHDQHYASETFRRLACGSRCDIINWSLYNEVFVKNANLFQLIHLEEINGIPYLFSHAGLTMNWINKVNSCLWKLTGEKVSIDNSDIINRVNALDESEQGQEMLAVVGRLRSPTGAKTGSVLWADIEEHSIPDAPRIYGLNKVFQVIGHTRLDREKADKVEFENLAMVDSQQCFIIDGDLEKKIVSIEEYEGRPNGPHVSKVIFLDIDGVLNTKSSFGQGKKDKYGYKFDPNSVNNLAKIIEEIGADIVISSSWKCMGVLKLQRMWKDRGLPGRIVDVTPDFMSDKLLMNEELGNMDHLCNRGCEIKRWLMQHKDEEVQYVIIDDMDDILLEQQAYFIQTDPEIGISAIDVVKAKLLFQKQENENEKIRT